MIISQPNQRRISTYKWLVLVLITLSQASISYVGFSVGSLAPELQQSFHLSDAQVGFATSANNLGIGLTALIFGNLVDRVGDKKIIVLAGLMAGVSIIIASFSSTYWLLLCLLIETGMWGAGATPAGSKAIFNYFVPSMRGMAMGIRQMGVAAGAFAAALSLPLVAKAYSWNTALMVAGSMAALLSVISLVFYQEKRTTPSPGSQSSALKSVLSNKAIWYTSIAGTTLIGAQFVIVSYTQLFLHRQAGIPYRYTFYYLALAQLAGMGGRVVLGIVSDRFFASRRKPILLVVSGIIAVLSLLMLFISTATPWWLIALVFAILGFTAIGWNGLWVTLVAELVDASQSSSALGVALSLLQSGVIVYPVLFGFIVDQWHSYNISWVFLACMVLLGSLTLTRVREPAH